MTWTPKVREITFGVHVTSRLLLPEYVGDG